MPYKTYKQSDSRWGGRVYNGSSTMATAGCGPTSVAMLAYAVDGKTNPWDVAKFMQKNGYAIRNNGTAWSGIPAAMLHFGLKGVKNVNVDTSMSKVWEYLDKGYCAVFLFRAGSRGGICWTTGGHYVAVTGYKVKGGKHYLFTRDSGGRDHTGWYCYETQMRGLIPKVWVGYVPGKLKKTDTKEPAKKTTSYKCIDVSDHQGNIDWKKVKADGINYAIIRAGYGKGNEDKHFIRNISEAVKAGVKVGVYWFSYAYSDTMAKNEAVYCTEIIKPYKKSIALGVYFDWEYDSMRYARKNRVNPGRSLITSMTKIFCEKVEAAGYTAGFYYNYDYKRNHYDMDALKKYVHWYALYSDEKPECDIQQYSSSGRVSGIAGKVDMNKIYKLPKRPKIDPQTDEKPKVDKEPTKAEKIIEKAILYAYKYGTPASTYSRDKGKPKPEYTKALDKIYPKHNSWKKEIRTGASCAVYVATTVKAAGADSNFICDNPPKQYDYMLRSDKWSKVNDGKKPVPKDKLKPGDIIVYEKPGAHGDGHILFYKGNGYQVEANYNRCYPHTSKLMKAYTNETYIKNTFRRFGVFRRKG